MATEAQQRAAQLGAAMGRQRPGLVSLDLNPNYSTVRSPVDLYAEPTLPPGDSLVQLQAHAVYKMHQLDMVGDLYSWHATSVEANT